MAAADPSSHFCELIAHLWTTPRPGETEPRGISILQYFMEGGGGFATRGAEVHMGRGASSELQQRHGTKRAHKGNPRKRKPRRKVMRAPKGLKF